MTDPPWPEKEAHDKGTPPHSGKYGHECIEWDGLYICFDCGEFESCSCFDEVLTEEEKKIQKQRRDTVYPIIGDLEF